MRAEGLREVDEGRKGWVKRIFWSTEVRGKRISDSGFCLLYFRKTAKAKMRRMYAGKGVFETRYEMPAPIVLSRGSTSSIIGKFLISSLPTSVIDIVVDAISTDLQIPLIYIASNQG